MGRESLDVEKTAIELVMNDNVAKERQLAKRIFDVAYEDGVYPSSIHEFCRARSRAKLNNSSIMGKSIIACLSFKRNFYLQANFHCIGISK